jgi:hypothetical protein
MENYLPTQDRPAVPDREGLRALYDAAVAEINPTRGNCLTTEFYLKIKGAVFAASYAALSDYRSRRRRMHTVAAPPGTGKTSFSLAFIAALTRYAEQHQTPYGVVFVTDQISRADAVYHELAALLPGKVAIWTTEHNSDRKQPAKGSAPTVQFERAKLRHYPVIVVTHKFYLGPNGHHARNVVRPDGRFDERALTVVDERPQEVETFEVLLSEAQKIREALQETHPEAKE